MRIFLLLCCISLFLSLSIIAQDIDKLPLITVTGSSEIKIAPDEVVFSLNVTKTNKELQIAKRLNDESISKILELTRRFAVAPQNVQTAYISVEMKYDSIREAKTKIFNEDGDEVGKRIFKGYEVSKTVIVRLTDISRFEEFFGEVLKTGLSTVDNVKFETSKLRENKDKARDMAMMAAKEKATAMSAAIGQTIGKAVKITEGITSNPTFSNYAANANSMSGTVTVSEPLATFAPGAITVSAQVTVSFQLN
jgi:uncharacterized protein